MLCKTINVPGLDVMLTQELVENLASAGRFGHKKHAFFVSLNILLQQMCGCFSLGVNPQVRQGLGRKRALMLWVFAAKHDALACAEALIEFFCTQVELLRCQDRSLDIMAQRLVAIVHVAFKSLGGCGHASFGNKNGICWQIIE